MSHTTAKHTGHRLVALVAVIAGINAFMFVPSTIATEAEASWLKWVSGQMTAATGDTAGNAYAIGSGSSGPFLSKYDRLGNALWTCQLNTDNLNTPRSLATDSMDNCYVAGQTRGIVTLHGNDRQTVTGTHAFVAKYSPAGARLWTRLIGSTTTDTANRMTIDAQGNCYVVGDTTGSIDGQALPASGTDPFAAKLDEDGNLLWVCQLRDGSYSGRGIGADDVGNVYIVGEPAFIATYDPDGNFVKSKRLIGNYPTPQDIDADDLGNAYICAWDSGYAGYAVKFDSDGVQLWQRTYKLNGWSCPKAIATCPDGSNDVVTGGCQGNLTGGRHCEAFARRYDTNGNLLGVYASPNTICGQSIGVDIQGNWYAIGDQVAIKIDAPIYITAPLQFEAESASIQDGAVETTQPDYRGAGYVHFPTAAQGRIEWNVAIGQPGAKTLIWRFSNPADQPIPLTLHVNGLAAGADLACPGAPDLGRWMTLRTEVYLNQGNNTVRLTVPATAPQGLCLDTLEVVGAEDSVALAKSLACSNETDTHPAAAALDGKLASSWTVTDSPQWIEVDLGQEYLIAQTKLTGRSAAPCQFKIEAKSTPDDPYEPIVDGADSTNPLATTAPVVNAFPHTPARYVRLTINGTAEGQEINIHEFGVFATPQKSFINLGDISYPTIQAAIGHAHDKDVIRIHPALYAGPGNADLEIDAKNVTITSLNPADPHCIDSTVLQGTPDAPVVHVTAGPATPVITGLTLTGGQTGLTCSGASSTLTYCVVSHNDGPAIKAQDGSDPQLTQCTIVANAGDGIDVTPQTAGRFVTYNSGQAINCLIAGNRGAGLSGDRLTVTNCTIVENQQIGIQGAAITLSNSILWRNGTSLVSPQLQIDDATVTYTAVQGSSPGAGNLDADPDFVLDGYWVDADDPSLITDFPHPHALWMPGDYHLRSKAGRWDETVTQWVKDATTSPCIDAGSPASDCAAEPQPNGQCINLGVYGGTQQASLSTGPGEANDI